MADISAGPSASTFDRLAASYDESFTHRSPARLLRNLVWSYLAPHLRPGLRVLDLGCGTGEDALWLAGKGCSVTAMDGSPAMLQATERKAREHGLAGRIETGIFDFNAPAVSGGPYDLVLSNFGAVNCAVSAAPLASMLQAVMAPGGILAVVAMGRFCAWETFWHGLRLNPVAVPMARARGCCDRRQNAADPILDAARVGEGFGIRLPDVVGSPDRRVPAAIRSVPGHRTPARSLRTTGRLGDESRFLAAARLRVRPSSDHLPASPRSARIVILLYNPVSSASKKPVLPMSLLALAAILEGQHAYRLIDGNLIDDGLVALDAEIRKTGARLLCVTVMPGPQLRDASRICRQLKQRFDDLVIVWGGYFPTIHGEIVMKESYVDYVFRGHCELAFGSSRGAWRRAKR
jgi:ubiquinone/menaquinone biosynthesis C-methylase UbiE